MKSEGSIGLGERLGMGEGDTLCEWERPRELRELMEEDMLQPPVPAVSLRTSDGTQPSFPSTVT